MHLQWHELFLSDLYRMTRVLWSTALHADNIAIKKVVV